MSLTEADKQELDRIVTALSVKLALVLKDQPEWEPLLARLFSGVMIIICAGPRRCTARSSDDGRPAYGKTR